MKEYYLEERALEGKENKTNKIEIPKEMILDIPKIIVVGRNEITIENHKGIINFEKEKIKVKTNTTPITIKGSDFEILYISNSTITISGHFDMVLYEG